jgi:hypothetical protein
MEAQILFLLILVVIFIVTRWFWCWYFRINERVALLKEINSSLTKLLAVATRTEGTTEKENKITAETPRPRPADIYTPSSHSPNQK